MGCVPGEYDIELNPDIPPVQNGSRRIPHVMQKAVEEKLQSIEKDSLIAKLHRHPNRLDHQPRQLLPCNAVCRLC